MKAWDQEEGWEEVPVPWAWEGLAGGAWAGAWAGAAGGVEVEGGIWGRTSTGPGGVCYRRRHRHREWAGRSGSPSRGTVWGGAGLLPRRRRTEGMRRVITTCSRWGFVFRFSYLFVLLSCCSLVWGEGWRSSLVSFCFSEVVGGAAQGLGLCGGVRECVAREDIRGGGNIVGTGSASRLFLLWSEEELAVAATCLRLLVVVVVVVAARCCCLLLLLDVCARCCCLLLLLLLLLAPFPLDLLLLAC